MTSWKITLPCTAAEAATAAATDTFSSVDTPPVLTISEPDDQRPDYWVLVAYANATPGDDLINVLRQLAPSASGSEPRIERLADQDWVTLSQQGLEPVDAGRFYVRTPHYPSHADKIEFVIEAGLAFGTGQHATTRGCLLALDAHSDNACHNILDLGTGTGLLAFAALALWPSARVTATDIDPIAIDVTTQNARANNVLLGDDAGAVQLLVADGTNSGLITDRAPYDLIIANILAQPLIDMAPQIARLLARGGTLILSGLLATQAITVMAAYRAHGLIPVRETRHGDWSVLLMGMMPVQA
jgi:ribosomal protein L11 methyltransferase